LGKAFFAGAFCMSDNLRARYQRDQLHAAARDGDRARVAILLAKKYPVNRFDEVGKTPLHYAVQSGHLEIVAQLIAAGANVNAQDERSIGNTPLSDNVEICSFEMVKQLIDAGADPAIPGWMQLTAIHRAQRRKDTDAREIQQLLQKAANRRRK
jgi:ankyrin repeat protein